MVKKSIDNFKLEHYRECRLPLVQPYTHRGQTNRFREVDLISCSFEGQRFLTELAPFPGVNVEDLSEAREQIKKVLDGKVRLVHPLEWHLPSELFGALSPTFSLLPSVLDALERMFFHIWLVATNKIDQSSYFKVSPAGLAVLDEACLAQVQRQYSCGVRRFKVKIGRSKVEQEKIRLAEIAEKFSDISFRFDANQTLSFTDFVPYLEIVDREKVEFVEEPKDIEKCRKFLPVAIDESQWGRENLLVRAKDFLIMKAQRLSFSKVIGWLETKQIKADQIVLSSCFDGSIGLMHYMRFAKYFRLERSPGFGPYHYLERDTDPLRPGDKILAGERVRI